MPTPLLELKSTTRTIPAKANSPTRRLIDDISLTIAPGSRIGLSGASGSGKSTLLRCLALLDPIDHGKLLFQGNQPVAIEIPKFRRQVVYLHQRPALLPGTVRENFQLPFTLNSTSGTYDQPRIVDWLQALGRPASLLDQTVDTLSGGEQQLVALLRAIQLDPSVLLLDEPTASLDADSATKFEQLVSLWFESSTTEAAFVWVSHDLDQLERMTNRRFAISEGKLA